MEKQSGPLPSMMSWMTGSIFDMYVRYQAALMEGNQAALWGEEFRKFDESCLGDMPTHWRGAIIGAKETIVNYGKEDPVQIAKITKGAFDKLPLSPQAKKEFLIGFDNGFDMNALKRYIKASVKRSK